MKCGNLMAGCSSTGEFAALLISEVTSNEWRQLEEGGFEGEINAFNRMVLLRLHDWKLDDAPDGRFDADGAVRMAGMLQDFLAQHMSDRPTASRWIVLSCLALAFVFHEPLHPVEVVKAETRMVDGKVTYYCPAREGDETLCGYCVCRPLSELPDIENVPPNAQMASA